MAEEEFGRMAGADRRGARVLGTGGRTGTLDGESGGKKMCARGRNPEREVPE